METYAQLLFIKHIRQSQKFESLSTAIIFDPYIVKFEFCDEFRVGVHFAPVPGAGGLNPAQKETVGGVFKGD
jgi:hypothetical protein